MMVVRISRMPFSRWRWWWYELTEVIVCKIHRIDNDDGEDVKDGDQLTEVIVCMANLQLSVTIVIVISYELTEVIVWMAHHMDSGMEVYDSFESFSTK